MIKIGIVGLGFMGKMHFRCYKGLEDVQIVAICDIDQGKFEYTGGIAGNIAGAEEPLDFSGIGLFADFDKMLAESEFDAVSIALPTYLHAEYTTKALEAGLNVLCEKPMAPTVKECEDMVAAAKKSGRILQIGQCIRFWPEYAKAKEIIDSGKYGKVKAATFQRLSVTPTWSWQNWLIDGTKGGGAMLDLHIHDSDFVQYAFGMPKAVFSRAVKGPSGEYDHVVTQYVYDDECVITAEGGWVMMDSFGFEMSFNIILEKATIIYDCTREPTFRICPSEGESFSPEVAQRDGYSQEIAHFIKAVSGEQVAEITTPGQSLDSVRLVLSEKQSAKSSEVVTIQ